MGQRTPHSCSGRKAARLGCDQVESSHACSQPSSAGAGASSRGRFFFPFFSFSGYSAASCDSSAASSAASAASAASRAPRRAASGAGCAADAGAGGRGRPRWSACAARLGFRV